MLNMEKESHQVPLTNIRPRHPHPPIQSLELLHRDTARIRPIPKTRQHGNLQLLPGCP